MKIKYLSVFFVFFQISSYSQSIEQKKFNYSVILGINIGATTPVPIPEEVREVKNYNPKINPQFGMNVIHNLNKKWGITSGILIERKAMRVTDKVKYMKTGIVLDNDLVTGYFVGENMTNTDNLYLSIPLYGSLKINEIWKVKLGVYGARALSKKFDGSVSDGYIRIDTTLGQKQEIDHATFDFSNDVQNYDFGLSLKSEYKTKNRLGVYANFNWGLTPYFKYDFALMDFQMRNIFGTIGIKYFL